MKKHWKHLCVLAVQKSGYAVTAIGHTP